MNILQRLCILLVWYGGLLLSACNGTSPFVPQEAFVRSVNDFAEANSMLAKAVAPSLESMRTDLRVRAIRVYLTSWIDRKIIKSARAKAGQSIQDVPDEEIYPKFTLLCNPRKYHARVASRQGQLVSVSSRIVDVAASPSEDIGKLVKGLRTSYEISVPQAVNEKEILEMCNRDLTDFVNTVYPSQLVPPQYEAVAAPAALLNFLAVLKDVVEPTIKAGLREIDSVRRANGIRGFLRDQKQRDEIAKLIKKQIEFLNQTASESRHMKVKVFADRYDALTRSSVLADTFASSLRCKSLLTSKGPTVDKVNLDFQACYRELWEALRPFIEPMVLAAAEYDQEADKLPSDVANRMIAVTDKLADIAEGRIDTDLALMLLSTAMRMTEVVEQAKADVSSDENRKKIGDALNKITEAFGN